MKAHSSKSHPVEGEGDFLRRVQRTGLTSLTVSLPKWWTEATGLHPGDTLRVHDLGNGKIELSPETDMVRPAPARETALSVVAHDASPHLLPRLVVGAYITGKDQVTLRGTLTPTEKIEIRQAVSKLLGSSIVQDGPEQVVIQNFVDPTRYSMTRLLDRMFQLLVLQVEECRRGVLGHGAPDRSQLVALEDEVDKVYRLMVRQIMLACEHHGIAKDVGAPSHHSHMGFRMIAKLFEDLGDRLFALGGILCPPGGGRWEIPEDVAEELATRLERFQSLLTRTMTAFARGSAEEASLVLNDVQSDGPVLEALALELPRRVPSQPSSLAVERALMGVHWMTQMLHVVNEVTINRAVDSEDLTPPEERISHGPATAGPAD